MKHRCPVCEKVVKLPPQGQPKKTKFFPFCSQRCKLIDLGAWLDARYKIPSKPDSQQPSEPSDTSSDTPSDER